MTAHETGGPELPAHGCVVVARVRGEREGGEESGGRQRVYLERERGGAHAELNRHRRTVVISVLVEDIYRSLARLNHVTVS